MLKAALFDLDGTLIDTEGQYSIFWGEIGKEFHPEVPEYANVIKGKTLVQILQEGYTQQERIEVKARLDEFERNMKYTFFPGALDFLRDLKAHGVRMAIVTSSDRAKMSNVMPRLPELNELMDIITMAEDFHASKPDPDCYLQAQRKLGMEKADCIVFEDALSGLAAGMASGMFTIGMATTNPRSVIESKCNLVLDSFEGITYEILKLKVKG